MTGESTDPGIGLRTARPASPRGTNAYASSIWSTPTAVGFWMYSASMSLGLRPVVPQICSARMLIGWFFCARSLELDDDEIAELTAQRVRL
jgi:hypothetical protein